MAFSAKNACHFSLRNLRRTDLFLDRLLCIMLWWPVPVASVRQEPESREQSRVTGHGQLRYTVQVPVRRGTSTSITGVIF